MSKPTTRQLAALKWLAIRNADGMFDKHQVLVAAGERAPVMRSTWSKLENLGLVERYGGRKMRLRLTAAGAAFDLSNVQAAMGIDEEVWGS